MLTQVDSLYMFSDMNKRLSKDKQALVLAALCEGNPLRLNQLYYTLSGEMPRPCPRRRLIPRRPYKRGLGSESGQLGRNPLALALCTDVHI